MEQSNFDKVIEIIGAAIYEHLSTDTEEDSNDNKESMELVNKFMSFTDDAYVLMPWPDSQNYMEEEWFNLEAILDVNAMFGSSAYFIPLKRLL